MTFDEIAKQNWQNQFTGIWACASSLHVPFDDLPNVLNKLIAYLKPNGILYTSFKDGEREKAGHLFCDMNEGGWKIIENQLQSAKTLKLWQTADNRVDRAGI